MNQTVTKLFNKHGCIIKTVATLSVFFVCSSSMASSLTPAISVEHQQRLHQKIDQLLKKHGVKQDSVGIDIRHSNTGQSIYGLNIALPLNPASVIKVLVTAAALSELGPAHTFATSVHSQGPHLCIKGQGDPSLVNERIWLLAQAIKRHGITSFKDLIVDESFLPAFRPFDASFRGDEHRAFNSFIGALSANHNSLTVHATGKAPGNSATLQLEPELPTAVVHNHTKLSAKGTRSDIRVEISFKNNQYHIHVRGPVRVGQNFRLYASVPEPAHYFGQIITSLLSSAGVSMTGTIKNGLCDHATDKPLIFRSAPLSDIIAGMNKFSNNFMAEMLTYHLLSQAAQHKTSTEPGLSGEQLLTSMAVNSYFTDWLMAGQARPTHLDKSQFYVSQGSGLSRDTRITAEIMGNVIQHAQNHPVSGPEFMASLSLAGLDGTLRKRFRGLPNHQWVRAKSGSLIGVVSLAGLLTNHQQERLQFVFLFNRQPLANWKVQDVEAELLKLLFEH